MNLDSTALAYQSGFGNEFSSEALPGALPVGQNSPQKAPYGLYAELLSGTAFTMARSEARRTWLYRITPSAKHPPFRRLERQIAGAELDAPTPNRLRWDPLALPEQPTDFLDGLLRIEITRTGEASTLGKVIGLMQQAERAKPPITRLLERYAGQYMLLVLLIAAVTWFVTNDAQAMLAVLVAACPCALVLSAPATAIAGIAVAARHGILIRSSAFLEELADLTSLVVDKTGTLTHGSLRLQALRLADAAEEASVLRQPRCRQQPSGEPSAGSPGGARCLSSIERYSRTPGVRRGRTNSGGRSRPRPARTVPATGHRRQRGAGA